MNPKNNDEPLVSIIILNYNAGHLLIDCVESILNTHYPNYEVIVVDNASEDNSHTKCKEKFPSIRLIENTENLGYCEGNNVGIRQAKGSFVVILNPDTLAESDWLMHLMSAYKSGKKRGQQHTVTNSFFKVCGTGIIIVNMYLAIIS